MTHVQSDGFPLPLSTPEEAMSPTTPPAWQPFTLTPGAIEQQATRLVAALDDDPFELIGYASIAAALLRDDLGDHLRRLEEYDARLPPVMNTIVTAMPMIAEYASPVAGDVPGGSDGDADLSGEADLPNWLGRLDRARITGAMWRPGNLRPGSSSYLLEITVPGALVTTAIVRLGDCKSQFVVEDLHTTVGSITEAAEWEHVKFEWTNKRHYTPVAVGEAVGVIRRALARWMIHDCERCHETSPFPRWPLTASELAWIVGLEPADEHDAAA